MENNKLKSKTSKTLESGSYVFKEDKEIDVLISENSDVKIDEIILDEKDNINTKYTILKQGSLNLNVFLYSNVKNGNYEIFCDENSTININNVFLLKDESIININVYLNKNAKLNFNAASINNSSKKQNIKINVHHLKGYSETNMYFYGICKNDSILIIDTDGIIKKDAKKAVIHQTTKGLIISKYSQIAANPLLHIDENDVIASHGASIGTLDDEDLYYLMSRGLTKEESEKLIIKGFLSPAIKNIDNEKLKEILNIELTKE